MSNPLKDALRILRAIVNEEFSGRKKLQKREFAIDFLDGLINLPFPLSLFERRILTWLIDRLIGALDYFIGKKWVKEVEPVLCKLESRFILLDN